MSKKQKILILSDLKSDTPIVLSQAIALSKLIPSDLEFLHVKKPTELVKTASQLSAVRVINESTKIAKKKIKELLDPISETYGTKVNYKYSFGNIKNEIEKYINSSKPDIIVLGKRRSNTLSFVGDNIIDFVLKSHKGAVFIASSNSKLTPEAQLSVGLFNQDESNLKSNDLMTNLIEYSATPIRHFKIGSRSDSDKKNDTFLSKKTVEYEFENSSEVLSTIANYIPKSNVNLLCLDRNSNSNKSKNIKEIIKSVKISTLIT
ncbi:universal stress protein [Psychroserpens sp.]|uniref:universal stress protein n=1 Tax=Psychroserpens sp. TaxID=2020870 RepID=UPI001B0E10DF|nr:universal stress protein [Psychroserpens sp.]MBO6607701.1 universal stress protein [Psychroserpens sp.]MBO6654692.1 universal stress protein [Psychroserpens sp.]MBO6682884.1 universal stress protein [Psychroserpens sp.]MBO6751059.1 universal stress protein [Psychroserpens sp.]MBO6916372.1 universal stress protein [Psychroserpens sp.]